MYLKTSRAEIPNTEIASCIVTVIVIIVIVGWQIPQFIEEHNEIQERIDADIRYLEDNVDRAILYCFDGHTSECDELMLQYFELCKGPNMELVPSCNDGRIAEYLIKAGLIEGN